MELKRFDLLFVKGKSLIDDVIEDVTQSSYSHVAIVLDDLHVCETNWLYPLKIRHLSYPTYMFDIYRFYREFTDEEIRLMNSFLMRKLGTPYDLVQAITNGIHILTGLPIVDAKSRMDCSEAADLLFAAGKIDLLPQMAEGKVTPGDLAHSSLLVKIERGNQTCQIKQRTLI